MGKRTSGTKDQSVRAPPPRVNSTASGGARDGVDAGDAVEGDVDGGHEDLVDTVDGEEAPEQEVHPPHRRPRELPEER